MFLLSSQDLLSEYKGFVEASNSVTLICAYIKIDELKTINISKKNYEDNCTLGYSRFALWLI
jgi:hypothetical protein